MSYDHFDGIAALERCALAIERELLPCPTAAQRRRLRARLCQVVIDLTRRDGNLPEAEAREAVRAFMPDALR